MLAKKSSLDLSQMQKQVNIYRPLFQFSLPIFILFLALVLYPTLFVFVFFETYDLEVL